MKKNVYLVLFVVVHLHVSAIATEIVVGYYPYWGHDVLPASQLDLSRLTHVKHAFAWPAADGRIEHSPALLYPELNDRIHKSDRSILLALGGWGNSAGFAPTTAHPDTRNNFITNVVSFCLEHNYDGVDLDWEYPSTAQQRDNMTLLVKEMRDAFSRLTRPQPLLITMAVTAGNWNGQWLDYDELKKYVDWFGCMTYDFHGDWTDHAGHNSPLYMSGGDTDGSVNSGFKYLTQTRGLAPEQILLGVPFYGRGFNASRLYGPSSGTGSEHGYKEIPALIDAGWTRHWDDVAKVPYIMNPQKTKLISYDDTLSVRLKAEYAVNKKTKGVMIWALGQDLIDGRQPLLRAVADPVLNQTKVGKRAADKSDQIEVVSTIPNPFNSGTTITVRLPKPEHLSFALLDVRGRTIKKLFDGPIDGGEHSFQFNAHDLTSGIYLCHFSTNTFSKTRKITHLK